MKCYFEAVCHSFQVLFLLLFVVASSSPVPKSFSARIKADECPSPVKAYLDNADSMSEYCNIYEGKIMDSRTKLCHGLSDLHDMFCSTGSSNPSSWQKATSVTASDDAPSVSEFCEKWRSQAVQAPMAELFAKSSFKTITHKCDTVCAGLEEDDVKPHTLCVVLLSGSQSYQKMREAPNQPDQKPEAPIPRNVGSEDQPPLEAKSIDGKPANSELNAAELPATRNTSEKTPQYSGPEDIKDSANLNKSAQNSEKLPQTVDSISSKGGDGMQTYYQGSDSFPGTEEIPRAKPVQATASAPLGNGSSHIPLSGSNVNSKVSVPVKQNVPQPDAVIQVNPPPAPYNGEEKKTVQSPEPHDENGQLGKPGDTANEFDDQNPGKINGDNQEYDVDGGFGNPNPVVEAQSPRQSYLPQKDVFVDAEDSHFFQYFMIISSAIILSYVAIVNKKKLIALVVEGRRDGSRRRHHSASYSKLDSNLEEAMSSNRTAVSSHHVLY